MPVSKRMSTIPPSPIRKLVPFSDAAKKRGIKVYHINIGQPDVPTPPEAFEAMRRFDEKVLSYAPSNGIPQLRHAMAGYFKGIGYDIAEKNIMVTNGGSEAIYFAFMISLDTGDEVLIPEPYYANYNGFAKMAGVKIKPLTTKVENGFHLPSEEEIKRSMTDKTRAILICSPNNPTGTVHTREDMEKVFRLADEYDLTVIGDEVYNEFVYDNREYVSVMHFPDQARRVILIDSVSKRYSACGARIGAMITKNTDFIDAAMVLAQARLCPPTIDQVMAVAMYEVKNDYLKEARLEYKKRRDVVFEELGHIEGVTFHKPAGAFYTVVKLPVEDAEDFARWLLESFSYKNETVMVSPASGFYGTPGKGTDEIRIAYVLKEEDMKRSIQLLGLALEKYRNR
ncbi:MAG TPA: pyridoxal phosphate-dependent aminotransferase [Firmicutes bacterium]|nr:pyridoxal phosphate-dependent aminotransferase [Bacillota bacterium]